MRPPIALAALALFAACATPDGKGAGGISAESTFAGALGLLPETLAGMTRQGAPQPEPVPGADGGLLRYASRAGIATVSLFTRDGGPIPDGPDSPAVMRELVLSTLAASAIRGAEAEGGKPPPSAAWRAFTVQANGVTPMRCAQLALVLRDRPLSEFVCVTGVAQRLLKIRLTLAHPPGAETRAAGYAGSFAAEVLHRLPTGGAAPDAAPPAPGRQPGTTPRGNLLRT